MVKEINQFFGNGRNILTTPSEIVKFPLTKDIKKFIIDLVDTATHHEKNAVGLSSNQIWDKENKAPPSIFCAAVEKGWQVYINPTVHGTGKKIKSLEGCMSLKDRPPKIKKRDKNVTIDYYDEAGERKIEKYSQLSARVIFHEYDHLLGKLI